MARISTYDQDSTLNKLDKVLGTDSETGATKNYSISSLVELINEQELVDVFDGLSYAFKTYEEGSSNPEGIINFNAGVGSTGPFSAISQIYVSVLDKQGNNIADYLDDTVNNFIRVVEKSNKNNYGVYEVTAIADHDNNGYKLLNVTSRIDNGNLVPEKEYFIANYSATFIENFSSRSITEFGDVTDAGSGEIITDAERTALNTASQNGLTSSDVVDNVTSTATNVPLSANQGKVLKDLIDTINTLLTSDNVDLDSLQEVVDFIEANKDTLDNLGISNVAGLQAALDAKQNTEVGKGLSANDFTNVLKAKLDGIETGAEVNAIINWNSELGDTRIINKPTDLTDLSLHDVEDLSDINSAGSGYIITDAERTKLTNLSPISGDPNVQSDFDETDTSSDAFILNKPDLTLKADKATTIEIAGTANEIEVSPSGGQDLSTNRTFTVGLPNDVTIGGDLSVSETIELISAQSSTPTFDNGLYYTTEDNHDTLHFRYHGHDLSIDYLTENIPTGILNGGELSTNTATTFDVAAGDGVINILNKNNSDPHPEIKKIVWSNTTIIHTQGDAANTDQLNTWIYVDNTGTIQQTLTTPSPSIWRNNIVLGSVIHSENVIRFVKTFPRPSYSNGNTFAEFVEIFGPLKKSGHLLTVNSTNNMRLDRSAGVSFAIGRNYETDSEEPNLVSDSASTPVFHRYSSTSTGFTKDDGTGGAGYTTIDPTKYDNNGTLTTVSSGHYSVQRLYHFPNNTNVIVAYYGKDEYSSMDVAEKNYLLEDFQEAENTSSQAIYLGALIVKGNATNLTVAADAKILAGGIFRSLVATNLGGVATDAALNDLVDVNITGVSNNELLKYNSSTGNWENNTITSDEVTQGSTNLYYPSGAATKLGFISVTQNVDLDAVIDGTGTAGKLPKFSDSDTLTDSVISESGQVVDIDVNGAIKIPDGATGDRPSTASAGMLRYNTTNGEFEGYTTTWGAIGGGGAVDSVNGDTGAVVLDTDDINEGAANFYYTEARVSANTNVAANTSKLAGIENGAEVNDVDSVNGSTGVVVLDTDDISEGTGNLYYTEARVAANQAVANNTAKNSYPNADATKLAGIEIGADVTDTTNVTAAGALMDSEVDANLKTLSLPASTTISAFSKTILDDPDASSVRTTIGAGTSNFDGDYSNLTNAPTIPTNNSQLTNGAGYTTNTGTVTTTGTPISGQFAQFTSGTAIQGRTANQVKADLNLEVGIDVQAWNQSLSTIAGLSTTSAGFIVGTGSSWTVQSLNNARTSLGLGNSDNVQHQDITATGDIVVQGNLTVSGTTTTINTSELNIADNIITLNSDETSTPSSNAGIQIERGTSTNVELRWNEVTDKWQFTNDGSTYYDIGTADGLASAGTIDNEDYARFDSNGDLTGRSFVEVKADLSLNNVENTAISTFAGSSNITTVGIINSGNWQGSAIADTYISSAATWNAKQDALTFGIANTNTVKIDHASVADNDYAKFTSSGLEGRSAIEVKADLSLNNVENTAISTFAGSGNIVTVGTINSGTWNGNVIAEAYLQNQSGTNTGDEPDASDSVKGIVELATDAETLAGTDIDRAVTPAGLAARSFAGAIGDGSTTSYTVTHNLNSRDVIVQLYDASSYETVFADVTRTTVNTLTITFTTAPTTNDIKVLVTKID